MIMEEDEELLERYRSGVKMEKELVETEESRAAAIQQRFRDERLQEKNKKYIARFAAWRDDGELGRVARSRKQEINRWEKRFQTKILSDLSNLQDGDGDTGLSRAIFHAGIVQFTERRNIEIPTVVEMNALFDNWLTTPNKDSPTGETGEEFLQDQRLLSYTDETSLLRPRMTAELASWRKENNIAPEKESDDLSLSDEKMTGS